MFIRTLLRRAITLRLLKLLSLAIGAVIGAQGCNTVEYGMPHADYQFRGTVCRSDTKETVPGIRISLRDTLGEYVYVDSIFTDSLGRYTMEHRGYPSERWRLRAEDVDGAQNGSFVTKDTVISIPHDELTGMHGSWYMGRAEKTVDLELGREAP